jgi:hypothetical protein
MDLYAAQQAIIDTLTAAGISATRDERDVNPPCVLVPAPAVMWAFRGWSGTWQLILTVPDAGPADNVRALSALIDATYAALAGEVVDAAPSSFPGVDGSPPLPAYVIRYATRYDN